LLSEELEWANEPPPDEDKSVSRISWPWWGGGNKDKDKDTKKKVKLPVPVAKEEVDCVVRVKLAVLVWWNIHCAHGDGRIASTGSTVNGNSRPAIHYIGRATCALGRLTIFEIMLPVDVSRLCDPAFT
jgi:hypothetical protein